MLSNMRLELLRQAYGGISRVDPSSEAYQGLCRFLDELSTPQLIQLRDAEIPWVSTLANNRVIIREIRQQR